MKAPPIGLFCLPALLVVACAGRDGSPSASDPLTGRTFLSESVVENSAPRLLLPGTRIRLTFHEDARLTASAGCNTLGGSVDVEKDRIVVGDLSTTEMGCEPARHQQDEWLAGVLGADPGYVLENGRLRLSTTRTRIDLVDSKEADPDRPLEATVWKLDGIVSGATVSSVPGDVAANLVFADGRVGVKVVGCNSGGGDVKVSGDAIEFGPLITTKIACQEPAAAVESAIGGVLEGRIGYRIDGAVLTLTHPGGKGLVLRAEG